jgi:hypothetical protein
MTKQYDDVFQQMDRIYKAMDDRFKEMDQAFKNMEKRMMMARVEEQNKEPWKPWFAWRPVKVNNHYSWFKIVYRRPIPKTYSTYDDWTRYQYGTIFDAIRDSAEDK